MVHPLLLECKLLLKIFYLILAALDLRCCAWDFSSGGELGLLFIVVRGLLIAVAFLVAEHGLSSCGVWALGHVGFSSCGT